MQNKGIHYKIVSVDRCYIYFFRYDIAVNFILYLMEGYYYGIWRIFKSKLLDFSGYKSQLFSARSNDNPKFEATGVTIQDALSELSKLDAKIRL